MPAFSYFISKDGSTKPFRLKGLLTSFLNQKRLNTLHFNFKALKTRLFQHLQQPAKNQKEFLKQYQTIFEINLACSQAIKINKHDKLNARPSFETPKFRMPKKGNSLSYSDHSPFKHKISTTKTPPNQTSDWLHLREYARVLTSINIENTRPNKVEHFKQESDQRLPSVLTNLNLKKTGPTVIVEGKLKGTVKKAHEISPTDKTAILYTENLTPDLVKFFPNISGIISKNGNLLSHLGIIAREHNIPTVSGIEYQNIKVHFPHLKISQ